MYTVYKVNREKGSVEAVKCENIGYPNLDEHGNVMYTNTHFESRDAAYRALLSDLEAWLAADRKNCEEIEKKISSFKENMKRNKALIQKIKKKLK